MNSEYLEGCAAGLAGITVKKSLSTKEALRGAALGLALAAEAFERFQRQCAVASDSVARYHDVMTK